MEFGGVSVKSNVNLLKVHLIILIQMRNESIIEHFYVDGSQLTVEKKLTQIHLSLIWMKIHTNLFDITYSPYAITIKPNIIKQKQMHIKKFK